MLISSNLPLEFNNNFHSFEKKYKELGTCRNSQWWLAVVTMCVLVKCEFKIIKNTKKYNHLFYYIFEYLNGENCAFLHVDLVCSDFLCSVSVFVVEKHDRVIYWRSAKWKFVWVFLESFKNVSFIFFYILFFVTGWLLNYYKWDVLISALEVTRSF